MYNEKSYPRYARIGDVKKPFFFYVHNRWLLSQIRTSELFGRLRWLLRGIVVLRKWYTRRSLMWRKKTRGGWSIWRIVCCCSTASRFLLRRNKRRCCSRCGFTLSSRSFLRSRRSNNRNRARRRRSRDRSRNRWRSKRMKR